MTQYTIDIGATPDDGQGDPLRTAFDYTNLNFDQVFAAGPVLSNVAIANNTIRTTNSNGNLILAPNGIGKIQANAAVVPALDNIYDLGSPSQRFNSIYIGTGGLNILGSLTFGNITVNNISSTGFMSAGGNVTGNYILGNGALLTGVITSSSSISNGTSNITVVSSGGNITVGVGGTSNVTVFSSTGVRVSGIISSTGNIIANASSYFIGDGSQLTGVGIGPQGITVTQGAVGKQGATGAGTQ